MSTLVTRTPISSPPTTTISSTLSSTVSVYPSLITSWEKPTSVQCHYTYDVAALNQPGEDSVTAWLDLHVNFSASTFSCYPPGMFDGGNSGTFSPAVCPTSWTTVTHSQAGDGLDGVTTRTCCSEGYNLNAQGVCVGSFSSITATPASYISSLSSYTYLTESVTVLPVAAISHHHIAVEYTEEDLEAINLIAKEESVSSHTIDLPLGGKLGITFGALVFVVIISLVICFVYRCWKSRDEAQRRTRDVEGSVRNLTIYQERLGNVNKYSPSINYSQQGSAPAPIMYGGTVGLGKAGPVDNSKSSDVSKTEKGKSDARGDVMTISSQSLKEPPEPVVLRGW